MPYVINGTTDASRTVRDDWSLDFAKKFFFPLARGEPLTPELLALTPNPYLVQGPRRGKLPAIFSTDGSVWNVNESVKNLIEMLEPNVHRFIPLNLRVKQQLDRSWGQYFILYPGQAIDAVVIEETDFANGRGRTGFELDPLGLGLAPALSSFGDTVLDAHLITGRHLWRGAWGRLGESVPFDNYLFCSDELADQIRAGGFEGWVFRSCKIKTE